MKLRVATCQFPVSASISSNLGYIEKQMRQARNEGAQLVHFCEGALSGYAGVDFPSFDGFDWPTLDAAHRAIAELSGQLGLFTVFGSSHRRSRAIKPHNSVYVVDPTGELIDRYDKRFCAGDAKSTVGDLVHYSPGEYFCTFDAHGVSCGILICHDYRYPELYREYKQRGVRLMLHSYHAGNIDTKTYRMMENQVDRANHRYNPGSTLPEITMPATMHAAAAANHVSISCSNSSARQSCFPSFFVRADGVITGKLQRNRAGVMITAVDTEAPLYDSTVAWRDRAMRGEYHTGRISRDGRSSNRKGF